MTYTVTCRACGNQVEVDAVAFHQAGEVKCGCGSADLHVEQPPPTSAEMIQGIDQLLHTCWGCGGKASACGVCGGTGRR